jgi:hypothetical protein
MISVEGDPRLQGNGFEAIALGERSVVLMGAVMAKGWVR